MVFINIIMNSFFSLVQHQKALGGWKGRTLGGKVLKSISHPDHFDMKPHKLESKSSAEFFTISLSLGSWESKYHWLVGSAGVHQLGGRQLVPRPGCP